MILERVSIHIIARSSNFNIYSVLSKRMKGINIILTLLLAVCCNISVAQQVNTYNRSIQTQINAVHAVTAEQSRIILNYQNYWPEIPSAFNEILLQSHVYFDYFSGAISFGIENNYEAGGNINALALNAGYAQAVRISDYSKLAAYIQLYLLKRSYTFNEISGELSTSVPNEYNSGYSPNASFSLAWQIHSSFLYAAYNNVLSKSSNVGEPLSQFTVYYSKLFSIRPVRVKPFVEYQKILSSSIFHLGSVIELDPLAIYVSGAGSVNNILGNLRVGLGYNVKNYQFHYTYLALLNNFSFAEGRNGAHEVTFLIDLQYKGKRKKIRAIKCPDF
jgi:hypothetical protein